MFQPKIHYHIFRSYCAKYTQELKVRAQIKTCLQQKQFKQYSVARITKNEFGTDDTEFVINNDTMSIIMVFKYASNKRNVYEETLMFDDTSLVGSLGGSLGLFVGFSFFGYAMPIMETIFDKIADCFERLRK